MMSHVTRATGMGSWPGTDPREAVVTVRDLLLEEGELVLKGIDGHGVVALVVRIVVVGAGVLRDALPALLCLGICRRSARLVVVAVVLLVVVDVGVGGVH